MVPARRIEPAWAGAIAGSISASEPIRMAGRTLTIPVSASPWEIQSAAMFPSLSNSGLPVSLEKGRTNTSRGSKSGASPRPFLMTVAPAAAMAPSTTIAAAARPRVRQEARGWVVTLASASSTGCSVTGALGGALGSTLPFASSRVRTAAITSVVSGAGSASWSSRSRSANASYSWIAPARSPARSSTVMSRRSAVSSFGTITVALRAHSPALAKFPCASACSTNDQAAWAARRLSRSRSSSNQRSNSRHPER